MSTEVKYVTPEKFKELCAQKKIEVFINYKLQKGFVTYNGRPVEVVAESGTKNGLQMLYEMAVQEAARPRLWTGYESVSDLKTRNEVRYVTPEEYKERLEQLYPTHDIERVARAYPIYGYEGKQLVAVTEKLIANRLKEIHDTSHQLAYVTLGKTPLWLKRRWIQQYLKKIQQLEHELFEMARKYKDE